jgi:hypothetical protein
MEHGQRPKIHEEEIRGLNISIEEIESNERRKRMKSLEPVETIRSLKMEVQRYKVDNGKMLKAQEEQNQPNTQLL